MRFTPARFMLSVWLGCIAAFYILPFRLVSRDFTFYGMTILWLFILVFCVSAALVTKVSPQRMPNMVWEVNLKRVDVILICAACVSIAAMAVELRGKDLADLAGAYVERSERASALLAGSSTGGSIWFQIGFITYGASYVYLVREIAFERKLRFVRLGLFGLLPIFLASMALGGRGTILYGLILAAMAYRLRYLTGAAQTKATGRAPLTRQAMVMRLSFVVLSVLAMNYFIQVFFVRSDFGGGPANAFSNARDLWGISFDGPGGGALMEIVGEDTTYLIFVFSWYLVQGLIMANNLFSQYDGNMLLGVYGLDLVTAVVRRLNGNFVGQGFAVLLDLNTYGFLPSAFGALYVDFKFGGLALTALWGAGCGVVYNRTRMNSDRRWFLLLPFVSMGIFFSLINTPLGFSNGLVTHAWLLAAFWAGRMQRSGARANAAYTLPPWQRSGIH